MRTVPEDNHNQQRTYNSENRVYEYKKNIPASSRVFFFRVRVHKLCKSLESGINGSYCTDHFADKCIQRVNVIIIYFLTGFSRFINDIEKVHSKWLSG